jgi:hypothetical protein
MGFQIYENIGGALIKAHLPPERETMLIALKNARTFTERTGLPVTGASTSGIQRETS